MNIYDKTKILTYLITNLDCCNNCKFQHQIVGDYKSCYFVCDCKQIKEEISELFNPKSNELM